MAGRNLPLRQFAAAIPEGNWDGLRVGDARAIIFIVIRFLTRPEALPAADGRVFVF